MNKKVLLTVFSFLFVLGGQICMLISKVTLLTLKLGLLMINQFIRVIQELRHSFQLYGKMTMSLRLKLLMLSTYLTSSAALLLYILWLSLTTSLLSCCQYIFLALMSYSSSKEISVSTVTSSCKTIILSRWECPPLWALPGF